MIENKPRYRVPAGKALSVEQAVDLNVRTFFNQVMRTDTDEVLKKAKVSRHALKTLLSDDEIDQAIERRGEELASSLYTLMPSEGAVADFVYSQLDLHLETILQGSMLSKLYGYDVAEMLWTKDDNSNNAVKSITSKPLEWFEPLPNGELLWYPNDNSQPVRISSQKDYKYRYLFQRHKPTYSEPRGRSLLSRVYWLWYYKTNSWRFWSKYLERFGSPLLVGKSDAQSSDDAQGFSNALLAAHNAGVVTIGVDEDVVAVNASGNGEAFATYNKVVNQRITTYLLGQTLTSGAESGGTYGQGKVHQAQQDIIFSSDRKHALKAVQGFIDLICYANGYEPPEFKWIAKKVVPTEQLEADKKAYEMGLRFNKSYFVDELGYDERHISHVEAASAVLPFSANARKASAAWIGKPLQLQKADDGADDSAEQFTPEQQELERLADDAQADSVQPFDANELLAIIANASDKDDLQAKLIEACGDDMAESDFAQLANTVLMVAELHGFADESSEV